MRLTQLVAGPSLPLHLNSSTRPGSRQITGAALLTVVLLCPLAARAAGGPVAFGGSLIAGDALRGVPHAITPAAVLRVAEDDQQDDVLAGVDKFAKGAKEANEVTLDKAMLGLAGMLGKGDGDAKNLMKKMDSVVVRNYEYATPGQYSMADVEQVRKRLDTGGWSHVVKTRSATETTDICLRTDAEGGVSEMVIIDAEPLEVNFIHLRGHMSAKDLSQMSGSFGGPADPALKQRTK